MRRGRIRAAGFLVVTASLALATTAPAADRFNGDAVGGRGVGVRPPLPQPIVPHGRFGNEIVPHGFFSLPPPSHRVFPRAFFSRKALPLVVSAPPVIVFVTPPGSDESPVYSGAADGPPVVYDPPALYDPPVTATVSTAPPPPPAPNVVQYPTGRYELRGDGLTTPYTWVWLPNPPPPPPTGPPAAGAPSPRETSTARPGRLYRWTDAQGILHLTDQLDAVPREFRAQQDKPS